MRRRDFLISAAGAAVARPYPPARAQAADAVRTLGMLMGGAETDPLSQARIAAFRQGLRDLGWTEGGNLQVHWMWSGGELARMRVQAVELARLAPDVILAHSTPAIAVMKDVSRSIPIVFVIVNDPVAQGFVASMSQPGGNVTGFAFSDFSVVAKSVDLLRELAPAVTRIGLMFNPVDFPYYDVYLQSFRERYRELPIEMLRAAASSEPEIEKTIEELAAKPGAGLVVPPDIYTVVHRGSILRSVASHRLPAIFAYKNVVSEGGLISYGADTVDIFGRSASYVDRILKGAKPADLPVQAPTRFELAINLRTARALGLAVPSSLLALTDDVVE
jgi:ABC-type uncharacterized transport system substrate-binding protein